MNDEIKNEITIEDLARMISNFATDTKEQLDRMESRLTNVESRLTVVETTMVTKSYLDDKLFDKESGLGAAFRLEDQKVDAVVTKLEEKTVISKGEAQTITAMTPFPKLAIK